MDVRKRTAEEIIILAMSAVVVVAVSPFAFYRLHHSDWLIAVLDFAAVLSCLAVFVYVWNTGKCKIPGRVLACYCLFVAMLTVALKGEQQVYWLYPTVCVVAFLIPPIVAVAMNALALIVICALAWSQLTVFQLVQLIFSVSSTCFVVYTFADRMHFQARRLKGLATRDPLTDVGNRRAMEEKLMGLSHPASVASKQVASLIILDIDHFKAINDQYGHSVGDEVLVHLSNIIEKRIRSTDSLYRFGGEEFVIIAENTDLSHASELAEQLRIEVEACSELAQYPVTISLGTAQFRDNETPFECLGRADKAMYQAKDTGRNSCCVAA